MAERVAPAGFHRTADPLDRIAQADRARGQGATAGVGRAEDGPDLLPPLRDAAPQGFAGAVDRAMGRVVLPTLLDLQAALARTRDRLAIDPGINGALLPMIDAVLADEEAKVARLCALRDR